jgi:nuclear pore complex protein Nup133
MFAQEEINGECMDKFFADNPNSSISWLNDLGKERYGTSAASLLAESERSNNLEVAHVRPTLRFLNVLLIRNLTKLILSIGKLSHLAKMYDDKEGEDGSLDGKVLLCS